MPKRRIVALSLVLAVTSIGALAAVMGDGPTPAPNPIPTPTPIPPPNPTPTPIPPPNPTPAPASPVAAAPDDAPGYPLVDLPVDRNVPAGFRAAVARHLANTAYRVVQWWADDLDGDGIADNIAAVCDDETGFYLVQHAGRLLEADMAIDGRNPCPDRPPPRWRVRHAGRIVEVVRVHDGTQRYELAIRGDRLVLVTGPGRHVDRADYPPPPEW
jgi:hypothetical protein